MSDIIIYSEEAPEGFPVCLENWLRIMGLAPRGYPAYRSHHLVKSEVMVEGNHYMLMRRMRQGPKRRKSYQAAYLSLEGARYLATKSKRPDIRDAIDEAEARAEGRDIASSFDFESLIPGNGPEGFPVDFDLVWRGCGYTRKGNATRILAGKFSEGADYLVDNTSQKREVPGGREYRHWLTLEAAKNFCLTSNTPNATKIRGYFIRREKESEDNRKAINEERTSLAGSTRIDALLDSVVSAVSTMSRLLEENHRRQLRLEESQEAFKATVQKQVEHVVEERDEALLLKAEAEQARTERIEKLKADCPYIGEQVARWAGIWASSGKPHASAMRAIGYMLGLDGLNCIKDDDESGEHRFTRFNRQAVNMIKAWKREHIKAGRNSIDIPRVAGGCWHVWLVQPADISTSQPSKSLGSISEESRSSIASATQTAMDRLKADGMRSGSIPYGSKLAADGQTLMDDEEEQRSIQKARALRRAGLSLRQISGCLADRFGVFSRSGKAFLPTQIQRMLTDS
jgi:phage anti-repressor protein